MKNIEATGPVAQPGSSIADKTSLSGRAFLAMVAANIILAFGPLLVRLADVSPLGSGFWRLALAAPVLVLLCRITRQPLLRVPRGTLIALVLGGIFFAADLATWHSGIVRTKLANATLFGNIATFTFSAYGLIVARRAVFRWPAFDNVRDEHVSVCVQADRSHDRIKKFPCPSDKSFPLQVFVFSGRFTDHHAFRLKVSPIHHDLGSGSAQGTLLAFGLSQGFGKLRVGILGENVVGLNVKDVKLHGVFF